MQELAFTMCNAVAYLQEITQAGVPVDEFAPRLAFYFIAQRDLFEEVAKFRAARRVWAKIMRVRFGARRAESMRIRFHCQTAAATLTKAQPYNNVVRTAFQALTAVLGGAQSLHTNGLDEAYAIPSEFAMKLGLRTQQILAEETNVASVVDPLAGSWYVEALTDEVERAVWSYLDRIDEMGGTLAAIERNFPQREIADTAYRIWRQKQTGEYVVVGVNKYADEGEGEPPVALHKVHPETERRKVAELGRIKAARDARGVDRVLRELADVAGDPIANLMPATIAAVKARATMGEIVSTLRRSFGTYRETPVF